jgi:hypothetical protein
MLITDQVATAPCTDPIQVRFLLLTQSLIVYCFTHSANKLIPCSSNLTFVHAR